jgi:hypothetical protein
MAKRKLTLQILQEIEELAADEYSLDDIQEEADIVRPLMEDAQVIEAIKEGRRKRIIEIVVGDDADTAKEFAESTGMTTTEFKQVHDENMAIIEPQLSKRKEKHKQNSANRLYAAGVAGANIWQQTPEDIKDQLSLQALVDGVADAAEALQEGNTTPLLEILIGNVQQLHLFNGIVAGNIVGDLGKQMDSFNKLSNIQLKVMQEQRKSIMAINEICNPKRTTFVKEISQHLHQNSEKLSEKKDETQTELLATPREVTEAEVLTIKDTSCAN